MTYEEIACDANNLYRAYKASVKGSKWKESSQKFILNFLRYIFEWRKVIAYVITTIIGIIVGFAFTQIGM